MYFEMYEITCNYLHSVIVFIHKLYQVVLMTSEGFFFGSSFTYNFNSHSKVGIEVYNYEVSYRTT